MIKIIFLPDKKNIEVEKGTFLLEALAKADLKINTVCGGRGICGKCKILFKRGIASATDLEKKLLTPEEIKNGFRLACQSKLFKNSLIEIPSEIRLNLQQVFSSHYKGEIRGLKKSLGLGTNVEKIFLILGEPTLDDQRSDWDRIKDVLSKKKGENIPPLKIPLPLLKKIPFLVREADFKITITICNNEVIAIEKKDTTQEMYGIAFDLGTTTVAGYLIDLKRGKEVSVVAKTNSQIIYGDNIISRIEFAQREKNGLAKLQKEIVNTLNEIIKENTKNAQIDKEDIFEVVVVGNTCMQHLFLGLNPVNIAKSPYISVMRESLNLKAKEIPGLLLNPEINIYIPPSISAFIGSDILAGILFTSMWLKDKNSLLLDLGTNGEVVLSLKGELWACSTAAGPALEGLRISSGMRAVEGAIDRVKFGKKTINWHTIGGIKAKGLCGSGIIDLVSEMLKVGLIDKSGKMVNRKDCPPGISEEIKNRILNEAGENKFLLVKDDEIEGGKEIYLTQRDIREVQLAKAAIFAGIKILLEEADIQAEGIQETFLAGAFGNFINRRSALRIRLLPDLPLKRIKTVGNAAGKGAELTLCSRKIREIGEEIFKKVKYVELSSNSNFFREFIDAMPF